MAKYECYLHGEFDALLSHIHSGILEHSSSASYEDGSDFTCGDVHCAVRVYERYSMAGGNRVSMNLTLVSGEGRTFLSAITAGGSQAMIFKLNTWGEESFLDTLIEVVSPFEERG